MLKEILIIKKRGIVNKKEIITNILKDINIDSFLKKKFWSASTKKVSVNYNLYSYIKDLDITFNRAI